MLKRKIAALAIWTDEEEIPILTTDTKIQPQGKTPQGLLTQMIKIQGWLTVVSLGDCGGRSAQKTMTILRTHILQVISFEKLYSDSMIGFPDYFVFTYVNHFL